MSELVKEIEEAIGECKVIHDTDFLNEPDRRQYWDMSSIILTLQRAREALRWKPIDENMPYDTILLFMSHSGNVRQDFMYDEGLERLKKNYKGWMEVPECDS